MSMLRGWLGEKRTAFRMRLSLNTSVYRRFHNVIVATANGTTQIDHLLVSPFRLFVIETKNIQGWIFGSENQRKRSSTPLSSSPVSVRSKPKCPQTFSTRGCVPISAAIAADSYQTARFSELSVRLKRLKADKSLTHRVHVRSLRERHSSTTVCPKCGSTLVERTARKGPNTGSTFLGCTGYPQCTYTRNI